MYVKIPRDRIFKLLGRAGKSKLHLEKATHCTITLDGNLVTVEGEPLDMMRAIEMVKAIGRGFTMKEALDLQSDDIELAIVEIDGTENTVKRLMGRVIGQNGRSKRNIEKATGTRIAVKGKTVAILGQHESVRAAKKTVETLIEGRTHAYAWRRMDKMMREAKTI